MVEEFRKDGSSLNSVFIELSQYPERITEQQLDTIVQYTLKCYRSDEKTLSDARFNMLKNKLPDTFRKLPPSRAVLKEHVKRSAFISGHLWFGSQQSQCHLPAYTGFGWKHPDDDQHLIIPVWTTNIDDKAYDKVQRTCGCHSKDPCSTSRCKCNDTKIKCLPFCRCKGLCYKDTLARKAQQTADSDNSGSDDDNSGSDTN